MKIPTTISLLSMQTKGNIQCRKERIIHPAWYTCWSEAKDMRLKPLFFVRSYTNRHAIKLDDDDSRTKRLRFLSGLITQLIDSKNNWRIPSRGQSAFNHIWLETVTKSATMAAEDDLQPKVRVVDLRKRSPEGSKAQHRILDSVRFSRWLLWQYSFANYLSYHQWGLS